MTPPTIYRRFDQSNVPDPEELAMISQVFP
jgi:hypothetical protein